MLIEVNRQVNPIFVFYKLVIYEIVKATARDPLTDDSDLHGLSDSHH
jgi:hypothetical protein